MSTFIPSWPLSPLRSFLLAASLVLPLGCGDSSSEVDTGSGKDAGEGQLPDSGSVRDASSSSVRRDARSPTVGDASQSGTGSEEICDGIDNDGDGIIDNRDVEQDGVCDCLAIAYLGSASGGPAEDVFSDWLNQRSDVGAQPITNITSAELAKYEVLVVRNLGFLGTAYSAAELDAIEQWVNDGGGLLTLTGYGNVFSEPSNVNTILARFGLSYRPGLVLLSPDTDSLPITGWVHPHPVTEGITAVGFDNGYPVDGDGTLLASEMGYDVMRVKEVGKGHVIAWGDEWITFDTEWTAHPDYQDQRLWQNMIKWLTVSNVCQVPVMYL